MNEADRVAAHRITSLFAPATVDKIDQRRQGRASSNAQGLLRRY